MSIQFKLDTVHNTIFRFVTINKKILETHSVRTYKVVIYNKLLLQNKLSNMCTVDNLNFNLNIQQKTTKTGQQKTDNVSLAQLKTTPLVDNCWNLLRMCCPCHFIHPIYPLDFPMFCPCRTHLPEHFMSIIRMKKKTYL